MLSVALSIVLVAGASGYTAPDLADARCMAAYAILADSKDAKVQQGGIFGTIYFVGKLRGRTPGIDVEAILRVVGNEVKRAHQDFLARCGVEMQTVGATLTAAGNALAADGF
ncbi:MAG: hypothetical protein ABIQ43_04610 [Sphingomonas sp.]